MSDHVTSLDVECYAGYRGDETPRRFRLGDRLVEVREVIARWRAPDHGSFKVQTAEGETFILGHDVTSGAWVLTVSDRRARP